MIRFFFANRALLRVLILFVFIFVVHFIFFWAISNHGMMMDEHYHYRQIVRFMGGDYTPDPELPMTTGYHLVLAYIGKLAGLDKLAYYDAVSYFRFISFIFSLCTIGVFYLVAYKIDRKSAMMRTFQYSFFPLVFPFFPLLYTDLFSLFFILIAFLLILNRRFLWGGLVISLSFWVRQNNLIWLLFLNIFLYIKEYGYTFQRKNIIGHIKNTYTFVLGPVFFGIYLFFNKRLSMGGETYVNFTLVHPSNIYLILFAFVVLFIPIVIDKIDKGIEFIKRHWLYILLVPIVFPIFAISLTNTHPYNQGTFFIHNAVAVFFTQDILHKFILFAIAIVGLVTLKYVSLLKREFYLLYPFAFLFLWPLWFIEQRYYIVPFCLFLLFRKREERVVEWGLLLLFIAFSFMIYSGIFNWKFFL